MARQRRNAISERTMRRVSRQLSVLRPDICTIHRQTNEQDAAGGDLGRLDTVGVFECRVDESGRAAIMRQFGPAIASEAFLTVSFPLDTSIYVRDVIEVAHRLLRAIYVPAASYALELTVPCSAETSYVSGGGSHP